MYASKKKICPVFVMVPQLVIVYQTGDISKGGYLQPLINDQVAPVSICPQTNLVPYAKNPRISGLYSIIVLKRDGEKSAPAVWLGYPVYHRPRPLSICHTEDQLVWSVGVNFLRNKGLLFIPTIPRPFTQIIQQYNSLKDKII